MKKTLFILLTLLLALSCFPALAGETESEAPDAVYLADFTVDTIDGSSFTLSDALKDHEMVLINLWATWCGPCQIEFPFLQEALEKNTDKVAVIALSVEPKDTDEKLKEYAGENGLTLPMGRVGDTGLDRFANQGTPTSVIVGRGGKVMNVEVGAMTSVEEFEDLFKGYSGDNYHPEECTYTVYIEDQEQNPIADVTLGFCTDNACRFEKADENGRVVFRGEPTSYHIQVIDVPEGYLVSEEEVYTGPYDQTIFISLRKE